MNQEDVQTYLQKLLLSEPLREPILRNALNSLVLPAQSRGLDIGCGLGLNTRLLASVLGGDGHITGLDKSRVFIESARLMSENTGAGGSITYEVGDARNLPWDDNTFDWACSVDFIGYSSLPAVELLLELARVVKPGGLVFVMAWSSQMLLPGYPLLEAQLNATAAGIAPFNESISPEKHFLRGRRWFGQAGFPQAQARTFIHSINAPLDSRIYSAMIDLFQMRWNESRCEVTDTVWTEYQRLCTAESPDCILNLPEYHAFFTYTMVFDRVL